MAVKAKPWKPQYPRRKDGTGKDVQEILHNVVNAAHEAEFSASNMSHEGRVKLWHGMMEVESLIQEAMQTFMDIYKIDANEQKRQFIKADVNRFLNPEVFLEEETPQD